MMRARVVLVLIDAKDDRDIFVLRGRRYDHLLDAIVQVLPRIFGFGKSAGLFDYDLGSNQAPGN